MQMRKIYIEYLERKLDCMKTIYNIMQIKGIIEYCIVWLKKVKI